MLNINLKIMRALVFLMGVTLKRVEKKMSVDFSKLNSSISQLSSDSDRIIAGFESANSDAQAGIDAAKTAVDVIDAKINAADPANPPA